MYSRSVVKKGQTRNFEKEELRNGEEKGISGNVGSNMRERSGGRLPPLKPHAIQQYFF